MQKEEFYETKKNMGRIGIGVAMYIDNGDERVCRGRYDEK